MHVQAKAQLNSLRMSPQKVRLLSDLVRGLSVSDALRQLSFSQKHAARPLKKLVESARANAVHNHSLKKETLKIETIFVNEGSVLKRWMPRAMGRATPIRKRTSHITLILSGDVDEKLAKEMNANLTHVKNQDQDIEVV
ncbi:MAG: 50S ribosomal protein L22 [Candidatus Magasanikbacteria bacterium]|nr:50S ribosomal protein L22 [Candidatus Magasanikbacteria bacterium]